MYFQGRNNDGNVDVWFGVVEDRDDPLKLGRVRVRVFGQHDADKTKIPTKTLPWAYILLPATEAAISGVGRSPTGIVPGTHVAGIYLDGGSAQFPMIIGSIGGAEIGDQSTCEANSNGFEAFTHGYALPVNMNSIAQDIVTSANRIVNASWMTTALSEVDTVRDSESKKQTYYTQTSLQPSTKDDEPSQAAFVNWILKQNDIPGTNSSDGESFRYWGTRITTPVYGAVTLLQGNKSEDARIVGFYNGEGPDGKIAVLSSSKDQPSVEYYKPSDVICYAMPCGYAENLSGIYAAAIGTYGSAVNTLPVDPPDKSTTNVNPNEGKSGPIREYIKQNSDMNYKLCTIHCSSSPKGKDFTVNDIDAWHKQRGWSGVGYHFVIRINGNIERARPLNKTGAHVAGYNQGNIGICLVGGCDESNKPTEGLHHFTQAQVASLDVLIHEIVSQWPDIKIMGHRDFVGVSKDCPTFNVKTEYLAKRGSFFANTSTQPKFDRMGADERKELQSPKREPQPSGDSSKDAAEVEPSQSNRQRYGFNPDTTPSNVGFKDPTGMYPTLLSTCFNGGSNTNPLAQGASYGGTPVFRSNNQRVTNVPMAPRNTQEVVNTGNAKADSPVGSMNTGQVQQLMNALGKRESSNNYELVNQYGYSGKYQFGADALIDLGYVKRGTTSRGLSDPGNWVGKDGISSRQDFLKNKEVQEKVMNANLQLNYSRLLKFGVISSRSTVKEVAGHLAVAHLLGAGGARKVAMGQNRTDANGTSGKSYYALGSNAVTESAPSSASSAPSSNYGGESI